MKKYYYILDSDTYRFYEQDDLEISSIEFENNLIKYRFRDVFIHHLAEEVKDWQYKKLINQIIFKK